MTRPVVVLVGVPGAGKTTTGRALADRLGVAFRDTDEDVEVSTGRAIPDIFFESGEAEFRRLEAAAVAAALRDHDGVLALGGGAVIDPGTQSLLDGEPVVWLRVGLASASQRAGLSGARPVLLGNVRAQMKGLMDSRAPHYTQAARLIVDTDSLSIDQTVDEILAGLGLIAPGASADDSAPAPAPPEASDSDSTSDDSAPAPPADADPEQEASL